MRSSIDAGQPSTEARRDGRLRSHVAMRYAAAAGGALVREALRAERLLEDGTGMRAVTEIELANVRLVPWRGR